MIWQILLTIGFTVVMIKLLLFLVDQIFNIITLLRKGGERTTGMIYDPETKTLEADSSKITLF